jgi:HK97 family phage portal protein
LNSDNLDQVLDKARQDKARELVAGASPSPWGRARRLLGSRLYARRRLAEFTNLWNAGSIKVPPIGGNQDGGAVAGRSVGWNALFDMGLEHLAAQQRVTNPLTQVGVVYTAVTKNAKTTASVPWSLFEGERRLEDHPLYRILGRPNDALFGRQLFEGTYTWLEMRGKAYWLLDMVASRDGTRLPQRIRILDADRVKVIHKDGELLGYDFNGPGGVTPLTKDQVVRFAYYNPEDPFDGLGPLKAARMGYGLNWKVNKFQDLFYDHGGFPSFYMYLPPGAQLGKEAKEALKVQFREEYLGIRNAWKPPILAKGAELRSIAINQRDSEWLATNRVTILGILSIFGMPPTIAGYQEDANKSISTEDKRQYYGDTVWTRGELVASILNTSFLPTWAPGLTFRYNWMEKFVQVMPEVIAERVDIAGKLILQMVPPIEAYRTLAVPVDVSGLPHMAMGWTTLNAVPVDMILNPPEEEDEPTEPPEDDDEDTDNGDDGDGEDEDDDTQEDSLEAVSARAVAQLAGRKRQRLHSKRSGPNGQLIVPRSSPWPKDDKLRAALWRVFERKVDALERRFLGDWRGWLKWYRDDIIRGLGELETAGVTGGKYKHIDALVRQVDDVIPPPTVSAEEARKRTDAITKAAIVQGWTTVDEEVLIELGFTFDDPNVLALLDRRRRAIKGWSALETRKVRKTLSAGVELGENIDKLTERVQQWAKESRAGQARVVARTEVNGAFNGSRMVAQDSANVARLEWLSSRDARVRSSHKIDGQIIVRGALFSNGLKHPHDEAGSASEVVNCRCVALSIISQEEAIHDPRRHAA